jgi:cysteine desulfurase/selenocysteine lyase
MESDESIRSQFPITSSQIFMNHASQSPLPKPIADEIKSFVDEDSKLGIASNAWEDRGETNYSNGKALFARLVNADIQEIALVENTSMGLNIIANLFDTKKRPKVITTDLEYPSVTYPWLRKKPVRLEYVKNDAGKIFPGDVEKKVDDETIAVVVSHVEYSNGFKNDLKALAGIAHEHGAYLVVDAMQSAGAIQLDVKRDDIDFLTTGCYKWLLAPAGAAYLYVKDELIEQFEPTFAGWASVKKEVFNTIDLYDNHHVVFADTASRFEIGYSSFVSYVGANAAMKMLFDFGMEKVQDRVLRTTGHLIDELKDRGIGLQTPNESRECRSGIVNFKTDDPSGLAERLRRKGIIVSARGNGVRVSPHYYNTGEEIDELVDQACSLMGARGE